MPIYKTVPRTLRFVRGDLSATMLAPVGRVEILPPGSDSGLNSTPQPLTPPWFIVHDELNARNGTPEALAAMHGYRTALYLTPLDSPWTPQRWVTPDLVYTYAARAAHWGRIALRA